LFALFSPSTVSIVIIGFDEGREVNRTLECLRYLTGPRIEICIVGAADALAAALRGRQRRPDIKYVDMNDGSMAKARNAGIRATCGELVVFITSGLTLETYWLMDITQAVSTRKVGAVGEAFLAHDDSEGPVRLLYPVVDRIGNISTASDGADLIFDFPFSFKVPTVGYDFCAFRRDALDSIGGFDERYDGGFAIHDVCCRLLDAGWSIRHVGHPARSKKFFEDDSARSYIQDRTVFSLLNNRGHLSVDELFRELIEGLLHDPSKSDGLSGGPHDNSTKEIDPKKESIIEFKKGIRKGLSRRERGNLKYDAGASDKFLDYPKYLGDDERGVFVFVSQQYPPNRLGGIGRNVHELARATASLGHIVHVITTAVGDKIVSFEDNVWVHRIPPLNTAPAPGFPVPPHIWARACAVLDEVKTISRRYDITAVHAPIWDCEGIAVLMDGGFPTVLGLQTPLMFWLNHHVTLTQDEAFYGEFSQELIEVERAQLKGVDAIHANSAAIAKDISQAYDVQFSAGRLGIIPHSIEDWTNLPAEMPESGSQGSIRLLFVGRLEWRKGIDVLLDIIPNLLDRFPGLHIDIVGDDTIPFDHDKTYRLEFEKKMACASQRVKFHGEVAEDKLRGFYRACDIFVAPSRYESFGMILVEAMIHGKPAVGCRAGGMVEIIDEGRTGLLAEPGDARSLEACLLKLIDDKIFRISLGKAARDRYEEKFQPKAIARSIVDLMRHARDNWKLRFETSNIS
jgi:glycosyltransferase involved in cell wall biosynthesis/GT2 family glycosyltransferase